MKAHHRVDAQVAEQKDEPATLLDDGVLVLPVIAVSEVEHVLYTEAAGQRVDVDFVALDGVGNRAGATLFVVRRLNDKCPVAFGDELGYESP